MKLKDIEDIRKLNLVQELIKDKTTKTWLKDIISGKRFQVSHLSRDTSEAEFFERYIWDNLSKEQQKKVSEETNILLEEELYKPVEYGSHLQNLVTLACIFETKMPGSINSKLLVEWKKQEFPNLTKLKNKINPLIEEFTQKIERAFGEK